MNPRDRIFDWIEDRDDRQSLWYGRVMAVAILASLVPLCFKQSNLALTSIEYACTAIFIVDYILRWTVADKKLKRGVVSFLVYPFTPLAVVDLVSILPTFTPLNPAFRVLRLARLFASLRAFIPLRRSPGFNSLVGIFRREKQSLLVVVGVAVAYVFACAMVIYNVEPQTFESYFEALFWAALSLTSTGFGDLHPVSEVGSVLAVISSLVGIAIIALPSGIITAGLLEELADRKRREG